MYILYRQRLRYMHLSASQGQPQVAMCRCAVLFVHLVYTLWIQRRSLKTVVAIWVVTVLERCFALLRGSDGAAFKRCVPRMMFFMRCSWSVLFKTLSCALLELLRERYSLRGAAEFYREVPRPYRPLTGMSREAFQKLSKQLRTSMRDAILALWQFRGSSRV